MKFYTWKDIERSFFLKKKEWDNIINDVEVYPDEVIVYLKSEKDKQEAKKILEELFHKNFSSRDDIVKLDIKNEALPVFYEEEERFLRNKMPLFQRAVYENSIYPEKELKKLEKPVMAFHSYKGGVGRTLSLLAFAKAWTNVQKEPQKNKLLIVDSDIEAPGLTWSYSGNLEDCFSYLDLLTLIQDSDQIDEVVEIATQEIGVLTIPIETNQEIVEHFFLPTFRYDAQLFDLYASPDTIIKGRDKEYILAEVLSKIAEKLGAEAVLVDLRAGISEYSAPLLLDPRVKKYCATSTSLQSVIGVQRILKYISKGLKIDENANLPTIFLNMVPNTLIKAEKEKIIEKFVNCFPTDENNEQLLDNLILEFPFASELVHLTDIKQILNSLKDRDMYNVLKEFVIQYYTLEEETNTYSEDEYKNTLKKISEFANNQITAEANGGAEFLLTEPIKNICYRFDRELPVTVIRGAKGSGKTFLYKKLLEQKNWFSFCSSITGINTDLQGGYFIPVLSTQNVNGLTNILTECIDNFNEKVVVADVDRTVNTNSAIELSEKAKRKRNWIKFWEELLVKSVNEKMNSFEELNKKLDKENSSIVFLIDGLEEILQNVSSNENQQKAIVDLCQNILNILNVKYENIGIVIFLRSDMAQDAIKINYEQFDQTFNYAELKWSYDEALKLAVWIVSQAVEEFYNESIPVEKASQDIINKYLEKLWGIKLGKANSNEAYSSRWILAALSDFNGQLQARDIIRFLKFAANVNSKKRTYYDRILMPTDIRSAVSICSKEKSNEIKTEYAALKPILEKLEALPQIKKKLPLDPHENPLTPMEEKLMIQAGYLTRDGQKLYIPEILRHSLGFQYERGARPKVLSLMFKR